MTQFTNLTPVNGFDACDLINARQNNYAWSISDLDDFIYVGTGRNILYTIIKAIQSQTAIPVLINPVECPVDSLPPNAVDNRAEIWRYRKDGCLPWQRVYKAYTNEMSGFRYMIRHCPLNGSPTLYAAAFGSRVQIVKSTNGVVWCVLQDQVLEGTSSRAMITHKGKLYVSTIDEANMSALPLLYSSEDPEFFPWEKVIVPEAPGFNPERNPTGAITNMAVFNNRIYVATSTQNGVQVWRTNGSEPEMNDWTKVVDNGFGNPLNRYSLAMGVFKNHLYVSGTKPLPLAWLVPMGCDVVRIDKHDNWDLVVGGHPLISIPGYDHPGCDSITMIGSGFNNPFNVYAWQIQEYKGRLYISTFDDSSNMEVVLTVLLKNRKALYGIISQPITDLLIFIYSTVLDVLKAIRYPVGFDLYVSDDGINFRSLFLDGLDNPHNYGGRILYVDSCKDLYLGTANPFQGCEVWKANDTDCRKSRPCYDNYASLWEARNLLNKHFNTITENMPAIMQFISKTYFEQ